jgi:hypothetical protein
MAPVDDAELRRNRRILPDAVEPEDGGSISERCREHAIDRIAKAVLWSPRHS